MMRQVNQKEIESKDERDFDIVHAMACGDKDKFNQPKFNFENSDFNNFAEIFNFLKDGYLYSKPKQIGEK